MPGSGATTTANQVKSSNHKEKAVVGSVTCSSSYLGEVAFGFTKWCFCQTAYAQPVGALGIDGSGTATFAEGHDQGLDRTKHAGPEPCVLMCYFECAILCAQVPGGE